MIAELCRLVKAWKASGRLAFIYTRKRRISLNGHKPVSYEQALAYLQQWERGL
jgi:hypothetical protein